MENKCINCNSDIIQNYCPNCDSPKTLRRIDGKYLIQEVHGVFSFERGFLFTIRELSIRPGQSVKEFLREDRSRLVKPVVFLIFTSLIYTLFNKFFRFEDSYVSFSSDEETAVKSIFAWIQSNYGYTNIMMAVFIGGWAKLFFRKYDFNIFEILVLLCFVMGMGMLIFSVFGLVQSLISIKIMQIAGFVSFVYLTWAIGQFFEKGKLFNYVKAFFAYILGMITFALAAILLGTLIDLLT